jgi:hypothetical protein
MHRPILIIAALAATACTGKDPATQCEFACRGFPFPSGFDQEECARLCAEQDGEHENNEEDGR